MQLLVEYNGHPTESARGKDTPASQERRDAPTLSPLGPESPLGPCGINKKKRRLDILKLFMILYALFSFSVV